MKRILLLSFVFSFALVSSVWAQRTVSGKVTDDTGESLPGVNVVIKGTTTGVTTDLDGNYQISIPNDDVVLQFSSVGMKTQEVTVGSRSTIDISMSADVEELSEIVVTANAIEREKRSIGYGISQVSGEELTQARETNIVNSLQGKTTGLIVNQSSGNLGGSSQVIIRGITSLSGANNPLWVVDGVPINNNQTVTGSRIAGNRDFFNGAAAINPDDIESINVLKGAAATVLYGSRAAAGAIVVTTKSGKAGVGGKPTVSVNSTVRFDRLFRAPDMQYQYAGGAFGKYDSSAVFGAWGAPIQGQSVTEAVTLEPDVPLRAYEENYNDFYETGITLINNVSIGDRSERGNYRLSVTSLNQEGILPNSAFDRITTSFNSGFKHTDWLSSSLSVQYVRSESKGTGAAGANDQNVIQWNQFTPSTDFNNYDPWKDASGNQINQPNIFNNNPLWLRYENRNERVDDRFIGNFSHVIRPIENLNITSRLGYDYEYDERLISNRVGTVTRLTGEYFIDVIKRTQLTYDAIADYTRQFGDIEVKGLVGYQYNQRIFEREQLTAQDLAIPELFNPAAAQTTIPSRDFSEARLMGLYTQFVIGYKNWLTVELSARNDWSSTLPLDNNSYFYPAVNVAWVFTDALGISNNVLSYGKLRASWAQVGNTTGPYQLDFRFFPETEADGQYGLNLNFPFQGQLGFNKTNTIPNQQLVPEEQTSLEFGTELTFFDGRFSLDATYYETENKNQIISQPIPESTGFGARVVNGGVVNTSGVEITLEAKVLEIGDLSWNSTVNFSQNKVEFEDLGAETFLFSSGFNSVQVVAVEGGSLEVLGIPYLRDSATGRPLIDPNTGRRLPGAARTFGQVIPNYTWGWNNQINYKGVTLAFLIDGRVGGKLKSATVEGLWNSGFTEETAENRQGTYIDREGVIDNGDGTVRDNDVPLRSTEDFWASLNNNSVTEHSIFDADFIKLREVRLSYAFPRSFVETTPFTGIEVGVEGRNLALLYSKVPHIDPEANLFGAGAAGFGVERNAVPSTRSFGFNVRLTF